MGSGFQHIDVYSLQNRKASRAARPWIARWAIDGRQRSRSFRTRAEADRFRSLLVAAVQRGESFDAVTGSPSSWTPNAADMNVYGWARKWLAEQWAESQPRTRNSAVESIAKLVVLAADAKAGRDADGLRRYLADALRPGFDAPDARWERWLAEHSLPLKSIDAEVIGEIDRLSADRSQHHARNGVAGARFGGAVRRCVAARRDSRPALSGGDDPGPAADR